MDSSGVNGWILLVSFFVLYGLEFFFPLMKPRRKHTWTNIGFAAILFVLNLSLASLTLGIAGWVHKNQIGLFNVTAVPRWLEFTCSIFLMDLWAGYLFHLIFHKSAALWDVHSVHHSDEHVDITTAFRKHPFECLIGIVFNLSGIILLGLSSWTLLAYITLSTIISQLEHANIRLPAKLDWALQWIIVTPNMHKIHHSADEKEWNSNYGNIFSLWDRIFLTYRTRRDYNAISYGLKYLSRVQSRSLWRLLRLPFTVSARKFK